MICVPAGYVGREWDRFVDHHPVGTFWHTHAWQAYQSAYFPVGADLSFAVESTDCAVVGVVPLFAVAPGGVAEFSYGGRHLPAPLVSPDLDCWVQKEVAEAVHAEVERLAGRYRVTRWLLESGQTSGATRRVVDLEEGLSWSGVRQSYRSLIHRAEREYGIEVTGADGDVERAHLAYQQVHRRAYGSPRADATYRMQAEWLEGGRAAVAVARQGGEAWGAAYWTLYKGEAHYASGAYLARDVSHAVVWQSLLQLRRLGARRACLGYLGEARTDKERAVEFFKRGFPGADEPVCRTTVTF